MNPPSWVIDTTGRSTTTPTNETCPSATAVTTEPGSSARSMPRCPAEYRSRGARNSRMISRVPATGHRAPADPAPTASAPTGSAPSITAGVPPIAGTDCWGPSATEARPARPSRGRSRGQTSGPRAVSQTTTGTSAYTRACRSTSIQNFMWTASAVARNPLTQSDRTVQPRARIEAVRETTYSCDPSQVVR